jgi:putative nucleotidyltransferase with HDIG domain
MATKSILLAVKEPQTLVDITQALGGGWKVTSVASEADALSQLEKRSFEAVLVDFNLASPDASDLLNVVAEFHPETVRFLLAYEADLALVAAKVNGTPQILPKPIDPTSLKTRIESELEESAAEQTAPEPVKAPADAAAPASWYADVLKSLEAPGITIQQAGEVIAPHTVLALELFKLTNSSYLGLPSDITDPVEAVETLGLDTVKAVVMALQFLDEHSRLKSAYLSPDKIWEHSVNVGQLARDLVLFETKDRALASQALIAGLLHDLGKIVLSKNFEDLYGRVHSLARKQPVALWEVEKEMFGADHGEIGACLLGMWNMPLAIVDAAALHHQPLLGDQTQFSPLAAVHVADVLENERRSDDEKMMVAPIISTPFLNQLGLLQRLPIWRARFSSRRSANAGAEVESAAREQSASTSLATAKPPQTGNQLPAQVTPTRTGTSAQPANGQPAADIHAVHYRNNKVYVAVAAVLVALVLWFILQPDPKPERAYARTPASQTSPASNPSAEPSKEPRQVETAHQSEVLPSVANSETPAAPQEAPIPEVVVSQVPFGPPAPVVPAVNAQRLTPAPATTVGSAPAAAVANVPAPIVTAAPEPKPQPRFKINGIIYTPVRPSAIVNGINLHVGEHLDGATVISITPMTVTLQIDGQRKSFDLR